MFGHLLATRDTRAEARQKVQQGALLLDVRTPQEYAAGHLSDAVNIPVQQLPGRMAELGPVARSVVVYCRSGGRSATAARMLRAAGHDVTDLGPMSAW